MAIKKNIVSKQKDIYKKSIMLISFLTLAILFSALMYFANNNFCSTVFAETIVTHQVLDADGDGYYVDSDDSRLKYQIENGEATVYGNNSPSGDLVIPHKITNRGNEYFVTVIGDFAFLNCTDLTSITIPNSVGILGTSAFECCESISSITIPNSVTLVGTDSFCGCSELISVIFEDGQNSLTICDNVFGESKISTIVMPSRISEIYSWAFGDLASLTIITFIGSVPATLGEDGVFPENITINVYEDCLSSYQNNASWSPYVSKLNAIPRPTYPNTGVVVDIVLPSAIILTLTISIVFVAFGGKKKKIIVK